LETLTSYLKSSNDSNLKCLASLVRNHSLFESSGEIRLVLNDIERGYLKEQDVNIVVDIIEGVPIACAITIRKKIMCYVKPEFRRKKIGTKMVSFFKNESSYAKIGFQNSDLFWESLNIPVF
jgi:hypothetical protein